MKDRTIPEQIASEADIRKVINNYISLDPKTDENFFYREFETGFNYLIDDLKEHHAGENGSSFMMIMSAAKDVRIELYEECNFLFQKLEMVVIYFLVKLDKNIKEMPDDKQPLPNQLLDFWMHHKDDYEYYFCLSQTRLNMMTAGKYYAQIPYDGYDSFQEYLTKLMSVIEYLLKELASNYAMYWGLDAAIRSVYENNDIVNCKEYITRCESKNYEDYSIEPLELTDIVSLLSAGHTIDTATKQRFVFLTTSERHTHKEAYHTIYEELEKAGYDPMDYLPDEAKSMADRARRYQEKRMEELGSLKKNKGALSK